MAIMSELGMAMKEDSSLLQAVSRETKLSRATLLRWMSRYEQGEEVWKSPGPGKAERPDMSKLHDQIEELAHGKKRMAGTGELYLEHKEEISRRKLAELVESVRRELQDESIIAQTRIKWECPGLVWAMDEVEWRDEVVLTIRDLGSKYRLKSLVARKMNGANIALWLVTLFKRHWPPLILKRDNGSRLKCEEVDKVLMEWGVIPLDSPCYYPEYNGSVEQAQNEFQRQMDVLLVGEYNERELDLAVKVTGHELNHLPRRILQNRTACEVFALGRDIKKQYGRRTRAEIYGRIREMTAEVMVGLEVTGSRGNVRQRVAAAWRKATQRWLQNNGLITVKEGRDVLPLSPDKMSQN